MSESGLETYYAPPERADPAEIARQECLLASEPMLATATDAVPNMVMVINRQRQIVYANKAVLDFVGLPPNTPICGLRTGEALDCIHATRMEAGCGTSRFCVTCGAVKAILTGLEGQPDVRECRLQRQGERDALTLRVWTTPFELDGDRFTFFAVADVSHEYRRAALERTFFHDVLNTAGGLWGFTRLLRRDEAASPRQEELLGNVERLAGRLIEEIKAQRQLAAAERGELQAEVVPIGSVALLSEVAESYRAHMVARDREIVVDSGADDLTFESDATILRRVIGNMVKNALEACEQGARVTLGCTREGDRLRLRVHNPGFMPVEAQLQIFQRAFSTKGRGRGLGTYSMQLLSQRYLDGDVGFRSSPDEGTTFWGIFPLHPAVKAS